MADPPDMGAIIWQDDFESDSLSSYFEVENDSGNFRRVNGAGYNGSWGMVQSFAPAQVEGGNLKLAFGRTPDAYLVPVDDGSEDYREIYVWMRVKCDADWIVNGTAKLFRIMVIHDALWSEAMAAHVWTGEGADSDRLVIDPASGTDANGVMVASGYNDTGDFRWLGLESATTAIFAGAERGEWHEIEVHIALNDAGQSNGVMTLWIDGHEELSATNLNWVGSYDDFGINAVFFENYINDGSAQAQDIVFDEIIVSTERVGSNVLTAGVATATAGNGQVTLTATAPSGGVAPYSYLWFRSTSSGFIPSDANDLPGFVSLSEVNSGLVNGTPYYFVLRATDDVGTVVYYTEKSATPAAPGGPPDVWFEKNFEDLANTTALRADTDFFNAINETKIHLETGAAAAIPQIDQTHCMVLRWAGNEGADYEISYSLNFPEEVTEVWTEVWIKFSASFTTDGPLTDVQANRDYKTFFIHTTPDGSGRFEFVHGNGGGMWLLAGEGDAGPNLEIPTGEQCVSEQDNPGEGYLWDGKWYRYRLHVKIGTGSDGIFDMWIKPEHGPEAKVLEWRNVNWAEDYDGMDYMKLGANMNQGTNRAMDVYWGRIRAWNEDPQWSTPQWDVHELAFIASGSYANPYTGCSGTVTFTGPSAQTYTVDMFWDGESRWRCRFCPDEEGTWTWESTSTDPDDVDEDGFPNGLDNKSGSFECAGTAHAAPVAVSATQFALERRDGTMFPWLGDTNWDLFHTSTGWPTDFKTYIDNRDAKRFSLIQTTFLPTGDGESPRFMGENEGGHIATDGNLVSGQDLNVHYFRAVDRRMQYIHDNTDMCVAMLMMWADDYSGGMNGSGLYQRWADYIVARYGAYNTLLGVMGEYNDGGTTAANASTLAGFLQSADPFSGRVWCHADGSTSAIANTNLNINTIQNKTTSAATVNSDIITLRADGLVSIHAETWYEEQGTPATTAAQIRAMAWAAFLAGGGFTYGHDHVSVHDTTWTDDLDDDGAADMLHLRDFWDPVNPANRIPWEDMAPQNALVTSGTAYLLREVDVRYIAYLPSGGTIQINLAAATGTFTYDWYNCRTGAGAAGGTTTGGATRSFSAPDTNDWTLHIRR